MKAYSELENALLDFVNSFELVFDHDWQFSRDRIKEEEGYISPSGTFINPDCGDEFNNWGNRGGLLMRYRRLRAEMLKVGLWKEDIFKIIMEELN